jgi:hypothetical protein
MIGGSVETFGYYPVIRSRFKVDIFYFTGSCTEAVELREDGPQFFFIGCGNPETGITGIGLLFTDIKNKDLKIAPHIHNPVKELRHDTRINNMTCELNFLRLHHNTKILGEAP